MTGHVLYRFFDRHGALLYIGITDRAMTRFRAHSKSQHWWPYVANITVEHFADRIALARAEALAIQSERPIYNVHHNRPKRLAAKPRSRGRIIVRPDGRDKILTHCNLGRDADLAKHLDMNHAQISRVLSGKQAPGNKFIAGVVHRCGWEFAFSDIFDIAQDAA